MLEGQVLSTSGSRWRPQPRCSFTNSISITGNFGNTFPKKYGQSCQGKSVFIKIHPYTVLAAWPWHNPNGLAARLEQGHYSTLPLSQVCREAGLLASLIFWLTIFPYQPENFTFPKNQFSSFRVFEWFRPLQGLVRCDSLPKNNCLMGGGGGCRGTVLNQYRKFRD